MKRTITFLLSIVLLTGCIVVATSNNDVQPQPLPEFKVGNYFVFGKYNDEPILWRYIENDETNGMLMLSDKILCFKAFDAISEEYDSGSNFWEDSTLRAWLNSEASAGEIIWPKNNPPMVNKVDDGRLGLEKISNAEHPGQFSDNNMYEKSFVILKFLNEQHDLRNPYADEKGFLNNENFTKSEKRVIKTIKQWTLLSNEKKELDRTGATDVYNYRVVTGHSNGDERYNDAVTFYTNSIHDIVEKYPYRGYMHQTTDKMFLLDGMQMIDCIGEAEPAGPIAEEYNAIRYMYDELYAYPNAKVRFWLRSPVVNTLAYSRSTDGEMYLKDNANSSLNGIRPAFYLDTDNAVILSGSGTKDDPYVINGRTDDNSGNNNTQNNNEDGKKKDGISVYLNGSEISFDQSPIIENNRTLVTFRTIFEALGAEVSWNEETQTVTAIKGDTKITLQIGSNIMYKNGEEIQLDVPAKLLNSRTLVPIRAVSEALGAKVEWVEELEQVEITTGYWIK